MISRELFLNLSLLLAASLSANILEISFLSKSRYKNILIGLIFGFIAILGMTFPYKFQEGLIFDGRSIVLSLVSLYYGPVSGIIAGSLAFMYRIYIGGVGAVVGAAVVIFSVIAGIIFNFIYKSELPYIKNEPLILFNFSVQIVVWFLMYFLPSPYDIFILSQMGIAFVVFFPVIGFIMSKIIQLQLRFKDYSLKAQDNQEKFLKMFNHSANPSILINAETLKISDLNESFTLLTGFDAKDLLNKPLKELGIFNENEFQDFILPRLVDSGVIKNFETKICLKNNSSIDVFINSTKIRLHSGNFYLISFFDLRQQKQSMNEILRLTRIYSLLSEVNQLFIRTKNKEELLQKICEVSVREGKFELVWIGSLDKDKNKVLKLYSAGFGKNYLENLELELDNPETLKCQTIQCFLTGKYQIIFDWETDPKAEMIRELGREFNLKSSASFPIKVYGDLLYTINFYSSEKNFFDSAEIALLDEVSKDISYALEAIENEEKKRIAEANLKENVRFLSTLINNLPGFIYRCWNDRNWTMEYLTNQVEEITGYKADDFIYNKNLAFNDIIHPNYRDLLWEKWQKILAEKSIFEHEYPIITKSGETKWVWERGRGIYNDKGDVLYLEGFICDITKLKLYEKELLFEKNKFEQLFDNSPIGIVIIDRDEKIKSVNSYFIEFFKLHPEKILGRSFFEVCCMEEMTPIYKKIFGRVYYGDKHVQEIYLKKKDNSIAYVQIMAIPIFSDAEIIGAFILIVDITKIKEAEENMKAAKEIAETASKMKDTFIANISHEIRTPLNSILGYSDLIREITESFLNEEERNYFNIIRSAGKRLMRTIEMIMNYSRIVSGEFPLNKTKLNLTEIIQKLFSEFNYQANIKNLDFNFVNDCGEVFIYADNYCITQAIANLIDNAIKYTKKGFVKTKLTRDAQNKLQLEITDTGIGLSKDYQDRIFEPYSQQELGWNRPYEGVGLGLALVKKYLNLNEMEVSFVSEEGKGTTFYIHFNDTEIIN